MTKKKRVMKSLRFEAVDRVPLCGGYIMVDTYLAALAGCSLEQFWQDKVKWAFEAYHKMDLDAVCQLCLPSSRDQFRGGYSLDGDKPFETAEDVLEDLRKIDTRKPLADLDLDAMEESWVTQHDKMQALAGEMVWIDGFPVCPLPFFHYTTYGYAPYFTFLLLYPDEVRRQAECQEERQRAIIQRYVEVFKREGWLFIYLGDDIATTERLMISPQFLDEYYWPYARSAMAPIREADIDVIWHCDGNLTSVIPRMIECGLTGFQGGQKEAGMLFEELAFTRVHNDRLPYMFGAVSVTTELPRDYETTIESMKHQIDTCARRGGGHMVFMTNTATPDCKLENIIGAYEFAREYSKGKYLGAPAPRRMSGKPAS